MARPSCEGPPATAENARLAERFAAKGYWGSFGHAPFHAYAIVQAWAQAAEHAGTFATDAVAQVLHTEQFDTALGRIGFDAKGDVTAWGTYVWHVCQDVEFVPLEEGGQVALSGSQMSHCDRQRGLQRGFFLDEGQAMARCGSLMVRGTA